MLCRKFGVDVKNFAIDRIPEELAGKSPKEIRAELSKTRSAMSEIGSRVWRESTAAVLTETRNRKDEV